MHSLVRKVRRIVLVYLSDFASVVQGSVLVPIFARRFFLKFFGVNVGAGTYINPGVRFHRMNLSFGRRCTVGAQCFFDCSGQITIADRVSFGPGVTVLSATHRVFPSVYRRDLGQVDLLETKIDRGCWIGSRAVILPGVIIEEGCVIGSGSVVTSNCLANGLYVGVPAKRVRDLPVDHMMPFHNGTVVDSI